MQLKKFIFALFFSAISTAFLLQAYVMPVFSAPSHSDYPQEFFSSTKTGEVEWRYRTSNGKKQRRLWSVTYKKWLTDWMPA